MADTYDTQGTSGAGLRRESNKLVTSNFTNQVAEALENRNAQHTSNANNGLLGAAWDFLAAIVTEGPGGAPDFNNNQHWAQPLYVTAGANNALIEVLEDTNAFETYPIPITNLWASPRRLTPEQIASFSSGAGINANGPHVLRQGDIVLVKAVYDGGGDDARLRYFCFHSPKPINIRITGAAVIAAEVNRWQYSWVEMEYLRQGKWQEVPGGLTHASAGSGSGSDGPAYAYNRLEAANAASGIQGNSYNLTNLTASMVFHPIRGGGIHEAHAVVSCEGKLEYSFAAANAIQGECP